MVLGGSEEPCISLDSIRALQQSGVLCPRVELDHDNRVAGELALAATRIGTESALWRQLFDLHTEGLDRGQKLGLLYRVLGAVATDEITGRIERERERMRARASEGKPK